MTTITIAQVAQPRTSPEGQTSKSGKVTTTDGTTYFAWADKLPQFEALVGQTVEVNADVKQFGTWISLAQRAGAPRPPVNAPTLPPRQAAPGGPVGVQPRNVDTDKHIFVTGIVGRAMGSGKFTASEIRVLTQAALEAFEMLSKPPVPAKPVPIETWTNNTRSEPPPDEPGDPGAQLQ